MTSPDHLEQLRVVVGFDQQQAMGGALSGGLGDRAVQAEEGWAAEQAGGLAALLQLFDLAGQFGVLLDGLAAEDHPAGRPRLRTARQ